MPLIEVDCMQGTSLRSPWLWWVSYSYAFSYVLVSWSRSAGVLYSSLGCQNLSPLGHPLRTWSSVDCSGGGWWVVGGGWQQWLVGAVGGGTEARMSPPPPTFLTLTLTFPPDRYIEKIVIVSVNGIPL